MAMLAEMQQSTKRKDWSLRTLVDNLQMLQDCADGTRTLPEEITESSGSVAAVRPAIKTGEVIINGETETYKTRREVTTTEKLKEVEVTTGTQEVEGVIIETKETKEETAETKIGERLHGVEEEEEDAHTHRGSEGQWGRARRACWDPVRAAGCPPSGTRGGSMPP